jgi:hypothetical protein
MMLPSQKQVPAAIRIRSFSDAHYPIQQFSWREELKELLSSKLLNIVWWPVLKLRQRYFTHSSLVKYCKTLRGFTNLWNTIQKGSFAYNCLFLEIKPYHRSYSSTDLADVTTLALFFGDEFIDGVCKAAGKCSMRQLLHHPGRFYLRKKIEDQKVRLVYRFDLNKLLPPFVMEQTTPKYGISYARFYYLLEHFLQLMNNYLAKMPFSKAQLAADKIMDVCNTCLESYLHDITVNPVGEQIHGVSDVLHFHEAKTRYMQEKFLELRCILADREYMMNNGQMQGWLDIMRVVQIYDDLQDLTEDDGFQDNLVISVAFHQFKNEWQWFKKNQQALHQSKQRPFLLSLYMPQTINYCLALASARMRAMNWEQQKIMNYLLFKNWFIAQNDEGIENFFNLSSPGKELLKNMFDQLQVLMPHAYEHEIKAHLVHTCFHLKSVKKTLRKKLSWTTYYQLRYNLLNVSLAVKAQAFDTVIASNSA